jgi:uncharacterized membrane protein YccC
MIVTLRKAGFRFPSKLEWLFSVKTFVASMVALYIALKLELPRPYWAMASVYVVSNPFVGATRSKAVYRAIGTAIGFYRLVWHRYLFDCSPYIMLLGLLVAFTVPEK